MNINDKIFPFKIVKQEIGSSLVLDTGVFRDEIFETRADEGFEGSGYDWDAIATVYLEDNMSDEIGEIYFDSEAGLFNAYSDDNHVIKEFAEGFSEACQDDEVFSDLFSRAVLE